MISIEQLPVRSKVTYMRMRCRCHSNHFSRTVVTVIHWYMSCHICNMLTQMNAIFSYYAGHPGYYNYSPLFPDPIVCLRDIINTGSHEVISNTSYSCIAVMHYDNSLHLFRVSFWLNADLSSHWAHCLVKRVLKNIFNCWLKSLDINTSYSHSCYSYTSESYS